MRFLALLVAGILAFVALLAHGPAVAQTMDGEQTLLTSAQAAIAAKNWVDAEVAAKKLVSHSVRWDYLKLLGDAQLGNAEYLDAVDSYGRAWDAAQLPAVSPAPTKAALSALLMQMGNADLRLKRTDEAIAAYTKAAPLATNPGLAYFSVCAVLYNIGRMDGTLAACNASIAADPERANAYFIKGSLLFAQSTVTDGKTIPPPGTAEALQKYLDLAPNGPHAKDAREMLDYIK